MISSDSFCEAKSAEAEQELNKEPEKHPICIIVLGMAGSGKTTFVHKLTSYLTEYKKEIYTVNLDPAVYHVPYHTNIDIRDSVKFKEVMKQYGFGPNGAIMTSLNFFTSQFDRVINLINKNSSRVEYVIFDTPGQIEVFTWSASGTIITEALWKTKGITELASSKAEGGFPWSYSLISNESSSVVWQKSSEQENMLYEHSSHTKT